MEYKIITAQNFQPALWTGGKTIELYIYPPASVYQKRNFQFRLSTAMVETEKSDFTLLPGFSRKLLLLEGELTLVHDNHYSRQLKRFEIDEFDGDWKTSSIGKCTDFNLMTAGSTRGKIKVVLLEKNHQHIYSIHEKSDWLFVYINSGEMCTVLDSNVCILNKGDLLIINNPAIRKLEMRGIENCELVCTELSL